MFCRRCVARSLIAVVSYVCWTVADPLAWVANAQSSFQLSGRVTNNSGSPLPGSNVAVLAAGTSTVITGGTTDTNGQYAISVPGGTYDVRVTPAAGSGFGVATALNETISGDRVIDFVLVPAGSATLSGRVLDGLGAGLPNQSVYLTPAGGTALS